MRFTLFCVAILSLPAIAGDDPEMVLKYRSVTMGSMAKHMGASKMIIKGQVDRKSDLVGHATSLQALGNQLGEQCPEGTGPESKLDTEALPAIWSDSDGFAAAVKAYQDATAAFVEAAKTGDLEKAGEAYGGVGQSCGGCHDGFRKDDD